LKVRTILIIVLSLAAFMGIVVWSTLSAGEVECEVCLVFDGTEVCRRGRGPSEAEALQAAQESACGGNARGMAELINCRGRSPDRAQCF
jgi:hypothetical protein